MHRFNANSETVNVLNAALSIASAVIQRVKENSDAEIEIKWNEADNELIITDDIDQTDTVILLDSNSFSEISEMMDF